MTFLRDNGDHEKSLLKILKWQFRFIFTIYIVYSQYSNTVIKGIIFNIVKFDLYILYFFFNGSNISVGIMAVAFIKEH